MGFGDSFTDFLAGMIFASVFALVFYSANIDIQNSIDQQNSINKIQDDIFSQITTNTTNIEILQIIDRECMRAIDNQECSRQLKDKFVINANR